MTTLRETLRQLSAIRRRRRALLAKYGPTRYYGRTAPAITPGPALTGRQAYVEALVAARAGRRQRQVSDLLQAQGPRCYLCGREWGERLHPTIDHVTPLSRSGRTFRNVLLACYPCNHEKANRDPTPDELDFLAWVNARLDVIEYA